MADEISVRAALNFRLSDVAAGVVRRALFDWTGREYTKGSINVTTSGRSIEFAEIGAGGWFWVKNVDATNFITIAASSGATPLIVVRAGEWCLVRTNRFTESLWLDADTSTVRIEYLYLAADPDWIELEDSAGPPTPHYLLLESASTDDVVGAFDDPDPAVRLQL